MSNENYDDHHKNSVASNESNANLENRTFALNSLHDILDQNVKFSF